MSTIIAAVAPAPAPAAPTPAQVDPACFAFNSYPPPLPLPLSTLSTLSLSTLDENAIMPPSISPRQSFSSCGASVRYTPRRRNALVPLPLLPPVPSHVVVKRIAGVVKILATSSSNNININTSTPVSKDVEMTPPLTQNVKIQFPVDDPTPAESAESTPTPTTAPSPSSLPEQPAASEPASESPVEPAFVPLRPRVRKDSRSITPRFTVRIPIPSSTTSTPTPTPTLTPAGVQSTAAPAAPSMPRPAFPVRPLDFNNLPANRKPTFDPIVFNPVQWSRPRVPSPLNPNACLSPLDSTSTIPPHIAALLSTPSSLPVRARLHPGYLLRARPRPAHAILTPSGGWSLRATLARGGKSDEPRRCALMSSESGRKLAWMGGDVRGAVEVWEAEQALEGMEDEEMEFDDDIEEITRVYVQPCDDNEVEDQEDEVVCTGERKAEEHLMNKESAVVCCPFEFEEPTTCTELDVEMECEVGMEMDMEVEMEIEQEAAHDAKSEMQKLANTPVTQGRAWGNVLEDEDNGLHC